MPNMQCLLQSVTISDQWYKAYFSCADSLVPPHRALSVYICGADVHNVYCNGNYGDTLLNSAPEIVEIAILIMIFTYNDRK